MGLENLRVIEIGQVLSAPYAGMILASLGAEVIKVEKPITGDDARNMGPAFYDGASMTFHDVNRSKRSVIIDLKSPTGLKRLFELLSTADVLIHNLRPGLAEQMGFGAEKVRHQFPTLIYCELTAFGHKGPDKLLPGYEPLLQAFSGLMSSNGHSDAPPARLGSSVVDQGTGMWAVIAILTALRNRDKTSEGSTINLSLLETSMSWLGPRVHSFVNEGKPSKRYGTAHPGLVPYQTFETQDHPMMICAGNDRLFKKLAQILNHPEWCEDSRYYTNRERLNNRESLIKDIQHELHTRPRSYWLTKLQKIGVPAAAVNSVNEALDEPQFTALGMLRPVEGNAFQLLDLPFSFNDQRLQPARVAPRLGEANEELFGHVFSQEESDSQ